MEGQISECVYCGQELELAGDGAWVDVESGRSGCGYAVDAGEPDGEHEPASERVLELREEIAAARRLGRDPQRQLCELSDLLEGAI